MPGTDGSCGRRRCQRQQAARSNSAAAPEHHQRHHKHDREQQHHQHNQEKEQHLYPPPWLNRIPQATSTVLPACQGWLVSSRDDLRNQQQGSLSKLPARVPGFVYALRLQHFAAEVAELIEHKLLKESTAGLRIQD